MGEAQATVRRLGAALTAAAAAMTGSPAARAQEPARKAAVASRLEGELRIDGRLDEPAWSQATPTADFYQRTPVEAAPVTFDTEVRVLYDDDAIYVGVYAHDREPQALHRVITRHDTWTEADWIIIGFDTYNDRRTAFQFGVTAGGARFDEILYDDTRNDASWNGVWQGVPAILPDGWSAEFRIPLSQLRFPDVEEQVWGFQVLRVVHRLHEDSVWSRWPVAANQRVSLFGELHGIRRLVPRRRLELLPYALGGFTRAAGDTDPTARAGIDVKYGVTGNMTLSATLNPDFGQVEADPSVVNLTAIETFYPEKRPFFLEGGDLFRRRLKPYVYDEGGPEEVFYTRRIGAIPHGVDGEGLPEATTIYGAAKLTGKTSRGLSVGVLSALTAEEEEADVVVEPLTHYGVARVKQDWRGGRTSVGVIGTTVHRQVDGTPAEDTLHDQAIVAGADLAHRFGGDEWLAEAVVLGSDVRGSRAAIDETQRASPRYFQRPGAGYLDYDPTRTSLSGWSAAGQVGRYGSEHVRGAAGIDARSPGFEANDAGYQTLADHVEPWAWTQWTDSRLGRWLKHYRLNASAWGTSTFEPRHLDTWGNVNAHVEGRSEWSAGGGMSAKWGRWDVRALRGGPAMRAESSLHPWGYVESNPRRRVNARIDGKGFWQPVGTSWLAAATGTVAARIGDHLELSTALMGERRIDDAQFVDTFVDGADVPHWVVGRLDQTTLALTLRGRLAVSPDLSVDLYAQPFVSRGDFGRYRDVTDPTAGRYEDRFSATAPGDFPGFEASDFRFRELRSNLVLRWEFLPGSVGLLVWSHGRTSEVLRDDVGGDVDALTADGEDVVLLKVSYWLAP